MFRRLEKWSSISLARTDISFTTSSSSNEPRSIYHTLSRVNIAREAHHLLAIVEPIACKDANRFEVFSCPWPPSSPFDKLREIERIKKGEHMTSAFTVTLDCNSLETLTAFWEAALHYRVIRQGPQVVCLGPAEGVTGVLLALQKVAERKQ